MKVKNLISKTLENLDFICKQVSKRGYSQTDLDSKEQEPFQQICGQMTKERRESLVERSEEGRV